MNITTHASQRGQQRGIKQDHMELLSLYGKRTRRPGGAYAYTLNRKARMDLQGQGHNRQLIDKLCHQVLIVSADGDVITVYHRD